MHSPASACTPKPELKGLEVEAIFAELPLFSGCPTELIAKLADCCSVRELDEGEGIVNKGDDAQGLVLVLKGTVVIQIHDVRCGRMSRGAYFGETYLLGLEYHWTVGLVSETDCTVVELLREDFLQACSSYAEVSRWYESIKRNGLAGSGEGITNNTCEMLKDLSVKTLAGIDQAAPCRAYFPGEVMVDDFCILAQGRAAVQCAGREVRELDRSQVMTPDFFGEVALLGLRSPHSTEVVARSVCLVRIIYRDILLQQLLEHQEFLGRVNQLMVRSGPSWGKPVVNETSYLPLFEESGCSHCFLQFLTDNLEGRVFFPGQTIVNEISAPERHCMFSLIRGSAGILRNEQEVATMRSGSDFGETEMLGLDARRTAVVVAKEACHVELLHQSVVVKALELFPEDREKVLAMAFKRMSESFRGDGARRPAAATDEAGLPKAATLEVTVRSCGGNLQEFLSAPFFQGMSMKCLDHFSLVSKHKLYLPGELITEQGSTGDSMFIVVSGCASAMVSSEPEGQAAGTVTLNSSPFKQVGRLERRVTAKVQELGSGRVFGELAMLGIAPTRSASVKAETLCSLWEVTQAAMLGIVAEFPDAQKKISSIVSGNLESSVPSRMTSLPLFKDFDQTFQMLLSLYCERRVHFPGARIATMGRQGDGLYVINAGEADFERNGLKLMRLVPGSHFGSTIMLGIHKLFLGTVEAAAVCHVLVITRESYLMALERYPAPTAAQALKRSEVKNAEDLQNRMRRIKFKENIMLKCEEAIREKLERHRNASAKGKLKLSGISAADKLKQLKCLRTVFASWHQVAREALAQQRREQHRLGKWAWWVVGQRLATEQRRERDRQVLQSACLRGELQVFAEDVEGTTAAKFPLLRPQKWARHLGPYFVDQAAAMRPHQPPSGRPWQAATGAPRREELPQILGMLAPELDQVLRALDQRQAGAAALTAARAKAIEGPDVTLLHAVAHAAATAGASGDPGGEA